MASSAQPRRGNRVVRGEVVPPALEPAARVGRVKVAEMQRSRLLGGAVAAVEKLGWSNVTVASIASRARVSRKTFYELFSDREDCLLEILCDTTERIVRELEVADLDGLSWRERVRTGLWGSCVSLIVSLSLHGCVWCRARLVVRRLWRGDWGLGASDRDRGRGPLGERERSEVPVLAAEGVLGLS